MIHVCFGLHDGNGRYSKFTGTTIISVFENTNSEVTIHILHDETLTADNREKFIYLAGRYGQAVKFYNVEELCPDKLAEILELTPEAKNSRVSVGALYRLTAPAILPPEVDKIIYLDSDVIVNLDLKELWQIELGDKILAGVPETLNNGEVTSNYALVEGGIVKCEDYFNSGVTLMNLNLMRNEEDSITEGLRFRAQNPRYQDYFDQNVLNFCFATQTLKLPIKFNRFVIFARLCKEIARKGTIYHYVGSRLPGWSMGLDLNDSFNLLWLNYFIKSPFFEVESIGRLYEVARVQFRKSMINLSAAMSGKSRAFLILQSELNRLVENFSARTDEEIIIVEPDTPLQKIIDLMNTSRREKFFFIMIPNFNFPALTEAGFVYGRDFLDGLKFLTEWNSYPLIRAM